MKGKITMTICVGCTAFILTMIMFTQFKTVVETDITAIETMRETELRSELARWKEKYEEIEVKIGETETKISEYKQELANNANSSNVLQEEVKEAETYLGYTSLQGQGIVVTLKDTDEGSVNYSHLLQLINELNGAGAEAISINDERVVSMTDIVTIKDRIIMVNSRKLSGPYFVKAIGDKKYFESTLNIKGGYLDMMQVDKIDISYTIEDNLVIPSFDGEQKFEYAKNVQEKE